MALLGAVVANLWRWCLRSQLADTQISFAFARVGQLPFFASGLQMGMQKALPQPVVQQGHKFMRDMVIGDIAGLIVPDQTDERLTLDAYRARHHPLKQAVFR